MRPWLLSTRQAARFKARSEMMLEASLDDWRAESRLTMMRPRFSLAFALDSIDVRNADRSQRQSDVIVVVGREGASLSKQDCMSFETLGKQIRLPKVYD